MNLLHNLAFFNLNHWEILCILGIVLILFGPKSLPALGRAMGKGMREFKDASSKFTDALTNEADEDDQKKSESKQSMPPKQLESHATGTPTHDLEVKDSVAATTERP